jgi:hypothetical protein
MSNATSPHFFGNSSDTSRDIKFISNELQKNKYALFLRKVSSTFPDTILLDFIYKTDYKHKYISVNDSNNNFWGLGFACLLLLGYFYILSNLFIDIYF